MDMPATCEARLTSSILCRFSAVSKAGLEFEEDGSAGSTDDRFRDSIPEGSKLTVWSC